LLTRGRWLWSRTVSSTVFGQFFDTGIFILVAFVGVIPDNELGRTFLTAWFVKVAYEVLATPLTYAVVGFLKKTDTSDYYDQGTNFNPFRLG
jgi:queuosine precursor transporter